MAPLLPIHSSFQAPSFKVHFATRGFPFHTLLKLSWQFGFPLLLFKATALWDLAGMLHLSS